MMSSCPDDLNARFGIADMLRFELGAGGFVFAEITSPLASAELSLHGAHVTAFAPAGEEPVLWLSPHAVFREDKAIRGGVPICWPWFSSHPTDADQPSHGFARISAWEMVAASVSGTGEVRLELELPTEHECRLVVIVGRELSLELITTNRSPQPLQLTAALHSYLSVGDIEKVRVSGLDGVSYLDDVDGGKAKRQGDDITIGSEVDRRYGDTAGDVLIHDGALGRTLRVAKTGSRCTVVWNPWSNRAAEIGDMPDDGYRTMLCVEAANAGADVVTLAPGETHRLGTTIAVA